MHSILRGALCAAALAGLLSACSDDNKQTFNSSWSLPETSCFSVVQRAGQTDWSYIEGPAYTCYWYYGTEAGADTAAVDITNLRLPGSTAAIMPMHLSALRYSVDTQGWQRIAVNDVAATTTVPGQSVRFSTYASQTIERMFTQNNGQVFYPSFRFRYVMQDPATGDDVTVNTLPAKMVYFGHSRVTDHADSTVQDIVDDSSTGPRWWFAIDPATATGTLTLEKTSLFQGMPALTMTFKAIPMTADPQSSVVTLSAQSLTPYIGDTPYPSIPVTNLTISVNALGTMQASFDCASHGGNYTLTCTGTLVPEA